MSRVVVLAGEVSLASRINGDVDLIARLDGEVDKVISAGSYRPPDLQDKEATPSAETQILTADEGYDGLGTVTINPIPSNYGLITWNGSVLTVS